MEKNKMRWPEVDYRSQSVLFQLQFLSTVLMIDKVINLLVNCCGTLIRQLVPGIVLHTLFSYQLCF